MGKVETKAPSSVERSKPIPGGVTVTVTGAKAGADVQITLEQTHGKTPFWGPETKTKRADSTGTARETFTVALEGKTTATLVGTADDGSTAFTPGPATVEVT